MVSLTLLALFSEKSPLYRVGIRSNSYMLYVLLLTIVVIYLVTSVEPLQLVFEAVMKEAEGALQTLASQWEKTQDEFKKQRKESFVPPVMIVVCANTDLAKLVYDHIAKGNFRCRS